MQFTAQQISDLVHGTVVGDPGATVEDFAKIEEGRPGSLSFLANPKYTHHLYTTGSSVVLVHRGFRPEQPVQATLIEVDDPYMAIQELLTMAQAATAAAHPTGVEEPCHVAPDVEIPADAYVGAFAYIGRGAKIGAGAKIYPQVYVGAGVEIGPETVLYPGVKVYHGCRIGARCVLQAGVVIGGDGFGFAPDAQGHYHKIPQTGVVIIDDDVELGANTTVDRSTMGATRIGRGTKLDNMVMVAHNVVIGQDTVIAAQAGIAGSTKIGDQVMIGGQAGLAGHINIGNRVHIGGQSGIPADIPDGETLIGTLPVTPKEYFRQYFYIRKLGDLFRRVASLERKAQGAK